MTAKQAKKVKVGDLLVYKPNGHHYTVGEIILTDPDPKATLPMFKMRYKFNALGNTHLLASYRLFRFKV